ATPYTEGTPFHPVIDLVQQGLAFAPDDTAAEKIEKLERAVTLARLGLAEAVPIVADFLGLAPPEGYPRLPLNPDLQRRKSMELLVAWNLVIAEVHPLVLLVEDLHWVDPSSLELFGRLMAQTATARVLLIGTTRPDFAPPWPARSNLSTLQLARLTKRQTREMVGALAGGSLSADMGDALVARADGVPLYVGELTTGGAGPAASMRSLPRWPTRSWRASIGCRRRRRSHSGRRYWGASSRMRSSRPSPRWTSRRCAGGSLGWWRPRSCSCAASRRAPRTPSSTRWCRKRHTGRYSGGRGSS